MAADADARILAERHDDAPPLEQRRVRLADGGAGLDLDRAPPRVVGDAPHRREVDDHARVRIGDETLEAVAAARRHQAPASAHRFVHRRDDLRRRADRAHVVGAGAEALVDLAIQHGAIARVVRRESFSGVVRLIGGGRSGHGHPLYFRTSSQVNDDATSSAGRRRSGACRSDVSREGASAHRRGGVHAADP